MELGATLCGPNRKPDCASCPCASFCRAYGAGTQESLPVKSPKRGRRQETMTVFILRCGEYVALSKRPKKGLLAELWEFPNAPGKLELTGIVDQVEQYGLKFENIEKLVEKKHIFTHVEWDMCGAYIDVACCDGSFSWFTREQLRQETALPTAFRQFWEEIDHV